MKINSVIVTNNNCLPAGENFKSKNAASKEAPKISFSGYYNIYNDSNFWKSRANFILKDVAPSLYGSSDIFSSSGRELPRRPDFSEFSLLFSDEEDFADFCSLFDFENYEEFQNLIKKDGIVPEIAVDIAFKCNDKGRHKDYFKLYPNQKEAILRYLRDSNIPDDVKLAAIGVSSDCVFPKNLQDKIPAHDIGKNSGFYFDSKLYQRVMNTFISEPSLIKVMEITGFEDYVKLLDGTFDVSKTNIRQLMFIKSALEDILSKQTGPLPDFICRTADEIGQILNRKNVFVPVKKEYMDEFLAEFSEEVPYGELNRFEEAIVNAIPFFKSANGGIGLKYSREEFLYDLEKLADTKEKRKTVEKKTGINLIMEGNEIKGYDGILRLENLNREDEFENGLYDIIHKFIYENEVRTGLNGLDNSINLIIKAFPEFINTIGKKQNSVHKYTLDIHSLLVLAQSINNPDYKKLDNEDKIILKMASIFHDIAKAQDIIDTGHEKASSSYMTGILRKVSDDENLRNRLVEFIKNHHWLKEYNTAKDKDFESKRTAFKFRRPNDFTLAKIMARSDLMAVSDEFYEALKPVMDDVCFDSTIENYIEKFYANSCVVLPDDLISDDNKKLTTESFKGKNYRVLNLHKKPEAFVLCHMIGGAFEKNFSAAKEIINPYNDGVLSCSLITGGNKNTFGHRKFGLVVSCENSNIISMSKKNQISGFEKGISDIVNLIYNPDSSRKEFREAILSGLGILPESVSDKEYAEFYTKNLANIKTFDDISDKKEFVLGSKTFSGKELKDVIKNYQEHLVKTEEGKWNEVVCYAPKILAVVAKEGSLDKIPEEVLNFAYKNDLAIVLI